MGAEPTQFSRVCPACGRRVPHKVTTCRCGAELPADAPAVAHAPAETAGAEPAAGGNTGRNVALGLLIVLAVGGITYFVTRPSSTEPPRPEATAAAEPGEPAAASAARPAPEWPDLQIEVAKPPASPARDPEPAPARLSTTDSLEDVVGRVMPAVVMIEASIGSGSGFYVSADTVVTNAHVVGDDAMVTLHKADGSSTSARILRKVPSVDLAVLRPTIVAGNQTTIPLVMSRQLRVGQEVIAIGSALGALQNTVTRGIVSALRESGAATLVQTDAAINPGNSGGPVLDRTGAAVGVATMSYRQMQGLNFAVAADHVRAVLDGAPDPAGPPPGDPSAGIRALTPNGSAESDRRRVEGERQFERALAELEDAAGYLDDQWRQFTEACYGGRSGGSLSHAWLAMLLPGGLPGGVNPGCGSYHDEFKRRVTAFRDRSVDAETAARRAGVYPGTLRDARRRHRLDDGLLSP